MDVESHPLLEGEREGQEAELAVVAEVAVEGEDHLCDLKG